MVTESKIPKIYPTMLTIAGSDPSGGAGIQADIKTATALGVYAMSAITAVTAQNTKGVRLWTSVGTEMLKAQLEAIFDDVRPDAVKIGMIPDTDMVNIIRESLIRHKVQNIILDPVCVATSGDALTGEDVPSALVRLLAPYATVITPNLPEASVILNKDITTENPIEIAKEIVAKTKTKFVLLKGGHTSSAECTDVLVSSGSVAVLSAPRIYTPNTHGTGCSLSSAIASFLALGFDTVTAVSKAHNWLHKAIEAGAIYKFGHGHGPINHLFNIHPYENNN